MSLKAITSAVTSASAIGLPGAPTQKQPSYAVVWFNIMCDDQQKAASSDDGGDDVFE